MRELSFHFKQRGLDRQKDWINCFFVNEFKDNQGVYVVSTISQPDTYLRVGESGDLLRRANDHMDALNNVGMGKYSRRWTDWIDLLNSLYKKREPLLITVLGADMPRRHTRLTGEYIWTEKFRADGHDLLNKDGRPHWLKNSFGITW
jgi:hypothetical protein